MSLLVAVCAELVQPGGFQMSEFTLGMCEQAYLQFPWKWCCVAERKSKPVTDPLWPEFIPSCVNQAELKTLMWRTCGPSARYKANTVGRGISSSCDRSADML